MTNPFGIGGGGIMEYKNKEPIQIQEPSNGGKSGGGILPEVLKMILATAMAPETGGASMLAAGLPSAASGSAGSLALMEAGANALGGANKSNPFNPFGQLFNPFRW